MNPDRLVRLPNEEITPNHLRRATWNLANEASGGRWAKKETRSVSLMRTVGESLAFLGSQEPSVKDSYPDIETELYFKARRTLTTYELYTLSHSQSRSLVVSELSPSLLEKIIKDNDGGAEATTDLLEGLTVMDLKEDTDAFVALESRDIYTIDNDGDIVLLDIVNSYNIDGDTVASETYSYDYARRSVWMPVDRKSSDRQAEFHYRNLPQLTEQRIVKEAQDPTVSWQQNIILFGGVKPEEEGMQSEVTVAGADMREHSRRVLALLALTGQGIVSANHLLRDIPSKRR